jgi:hypothetical protein
LRLSLNQKHYHPHKLIALQWIPNPEDYPVIDHINRIKTDNRIENLRWTTIKNNNRNHATNHGVDVEYFDELPHHSQPLILYNGHDIEPGYSFDEEYNVYFWNGLKFYKLKRLTQFGKYDFVMVRGISGKNIKVSIHKLINGDYEL